MTDGARDRLIAALVFANGLLIGALLGLMIARWLLL